MTQKLQVEELFGWFVKNRSCFCRKILKEQDEEQDQDLRNCRKLWRWCRSGLLGSCVFVDFDVGVFFWGGGGSCGVVAE
jgi:hypothetical protein